MIRIGSRGSALALAQTHSIQRQLADRLPGEEITVTVIRTSADRDTTIPLRKAPTTGVFVKELEEALLAGRVDLAVHSMKDVPTLVPGPLSVAVVPPREDPRDALIARDGTARIADLPPEALVGTGSLRRAAQLLAVRPDLRVRDIRGNVDTRLQKLDSGAYDAIVLACAGLNRLGLQDRISGRLEIVDMIPAPGQGALALEIRKEDEALLEKLRFLHDADTASAVTAERAFLRRMGGGCNTPLGVHGRVEDGMLRLAAVLALPDGSRQIRDSSQYSSAAPDQAGETLAERVLSNGGSELLAAVG